MVPGSNEMNLSTMSIRKKNWKNEDEGEGRMEKRTPETAGRRSMNIMGNY